jgi:hypothetical protein
MDTLNTFKNTLIYSMFTKWFYYAWAGQSVKPVISKQPQ